MRYKFNVDYTKVKASRLVKENGKSKCVEVARIEINLMDARPYHWTGEKGFGGFGCQVFGTPACTIEDIEQIKKALPSLRRKRLDFVLYKLDRELLEAAMSVTGRAFPYEETAYPINITDLNPDDLNKYAHALKTRANKLSNQLVKIAKEIESKGSKGTTKPLPVSHSLIRDQVDEYKEYWYYPKK